MKNVRDEIDQYLALWDQAQKQFPQEKRKPAARPSPSYFGMQNAVNAQDITEDEEEHWRDIYYRSLEIDPDEIRGGAEEGLLSEEEIDQQCLAGMMDLREAKEAKRKAAEARSKPKARKPASSKKKKVERDRRKPRDGDETPDWDEEKDGFGKDLAKKLGDVDFTANPVHFASVGNDSDLRVTPNFTDGDELRQLARLKSLLYDLESELLGTDIRGGNTEPIRIKMIKVRRQCESLSQRLIPDPRKDVS
jgi:hypothetical protein